MNKKNNIDLKEIDSKIIDIGMKMDLSDDTMIKLFNLFLTSNPNYLYNKTYILDSLDKFKSNIKILQDKLKLNMDLANSFKAVTCKNGYWFIIIDDYFIITSLFKGVCMSYYEICSKKLNNKLNHEMKEIKDKVSKYIICNNLYSINNKSTVRVFYNGFQRLFYNVEEKEIINKIQTFINECDCIILERIKYNERK